MKITLLTIFPTIFSSFLSCGIVKRAVNKKKLEIEIINIRDFAKDRHKTVDGKPYGGGAGMILRADIIVDAIESIKNKVQPHIILMSPQGRLLNQNIVKSLAKLDHLLLICGHYEGADYRVEKFINDEISIGNYILSGGEVPAMVIVDAVSRQLHSVVGKKQSIESDSLANNLLKYPQYTKPLSFRGLMIPKILLSGNHQAIFKWRGEMAKKITRQKRPDLLKSKN